MNCSFTEKISSLIDGELLQAEAREVERHLVGCHECQTARADFLNLRSQIAGIETSLQPAVQNRALKKILASDRREPTRRLEWSFGPAAVAFAALLIVAALVGFLMYRNSNTRSPQEQLAVQNPSPAP